MKPWLKIAAVGLVLAGSSGLAYAAEPDAAIQYRKAVMSAVGANMKASAMILKGEVEHKDALATHAGNLHNATMLAPAAFEQNTAGQGSEKTTVKGSSVWDEWDEFDAGLKELQEKSGAFAEAAASGDMAATGEALKALGGVCKDCHDEFREK